MTQKVFISYAAQDRAFAQALKPRLGEFLPFRSQPLDVLDVQSHVSAGDDVRKAVKEAIDEANTVVIVSSPAADTSQWVNYEAGLADALGKDIVIVNRKGSGKSAILHRFSDSARFIEMDDMD